MSFGFRIQLGAMLRDRAIVVSVILKKRGLRIVRRGKVIVKLQR